MVALLVELLPAALASHVSTMRVPTLLLPNQLSAVAPGKALAVRALPHGNESPKKLLALAEHNPGHCGHLRNKPALRRTLSLSPSLYLGLSNK